VKILRRYILAEIAGPYAIGLFAFTLVVLLHRFSKLADLVIAKGVPPSLLGRLVVSLFPVFLEVTLPAALLLAILLALGRLGADSETTAFRTAGVGMREVAVPVLLLSGATFLASLLIGWSGVPWGQREMRSVLAQIVSLRAGAAAEERTFREIAPGVLLFADRVSADGTRMEGVLLSRSLNGKDALIALAREGEFFPDGGLGAVGLKLRDGSIHQDDPEAGAYRVAAFRTMDFRIPRGIAASGEDNSPRSLTLPQLRRKAHEAGEERRSRYLFHFHRRLSLAASCLAFGILAVPLGLFQRARGKSPAFALTVALIFFYYLFLAAASALEESAPGAMIILLWLPNAMVLSLAVWILWRSESRIFTPPALFGRSGRTR
jgi:lipopolysaccharide export system permease protein